MCETKELVYTKAAGVVEGTPHDNMAKIHAYLTRKSIIDDYPGRSSSITLTNVVKNEVHLLKQQNVSEVENASAEIVHIKYKRYTYLTGTHASNSESSVIAVHYKPTPTA